MRRILYVEDDPLDAMLLRREFETLAPDTAIDLESSGEAAYDRLAQASARHWDGLIVDISMPGMGGLAFISSVRAMSGFDALPIIAFSTSRLKVDRQIALERGADAFVVKSDNSASYEALLLKLQAAILERGESCA